MNEDYAGFRFKAARGIDALLHIMAAAPLLCFLPIYLGVLTFALTNGRWPMAHTDPEPWGGWAYDLQCTFVGVIVWTALVGTPVVLPFWRLLNPTARWSTRLFLFGGCLLLAVLLLIHDPGHYVDWYWD